MNLVEIKLLLALVPVVAVVVSLFALSVIESILQSHRLRRPHRMMGYPPVYKDPYTPRVMPITGEGDGECGAGGGIGCTTPPRGPLG